MGRYRGRFAPSPTGPLHLGSLVAAVASYADALANTGEWYVRIDDIDPPREQAGATDSIIETLAAHGLFARDNGADNLQKHLFITPCSTAIVRQSLRTESYSDALQQLVKDQRVFACECSRKSLNDFLPRYPGYCDQKQLPFENHALRVRVTDGVYRFQDQVFGCYEQNVAEQFGPFVLRRRDGLWSYQLCNVADEIADQVTHVVRGEDLLDNTPRQLVLYEYLDQNPPAYCHVPVVRQPNGDKLSKQTGATALDNTQALENLQTAWRFLGQIESRASTIGEFWHFVEKSWDTARIPAVKNLERNPIQLDN